MSDPKTEMELDNVIKSTMNHLKSKIIDKSLNFGLQKKFPLNGFKMMVNSGAKGSNVNHALICCLLGQQTLEGKRAAMMPSGRTLPSFIPYDPNPRSGGFIGDKFLNGLRP